MKKRRIIVFVICLALLASLVACGVKTKDEVQAEAKAETKADAQAETKSEAKSDAADSASAHSASEISLKLLYNSSDEMTANVVRDLLAKQGFQVEMSAAADGSTFREQEKGGNFDISIASWANPVGTPDYGCRGIWESVGDSNMFGINDAHLDELVNSAAAQTSDVYINTYGEAETYVIEEQCYMTPLYMAMYARPNGSALAAGSVTPNQRWESMRYADSSQADTRTLNITQTGSNFFTLDCIRADDLTSGYTLDEAYIHLLTLMPDWSVSVKESLSYSYAISESNTGYYFLLRDDCFFARVDADANAYNSGVMVSGEDVVYSLERAMDKDSTPLHACYSMFASMSGVEIVTDMAELESTKTASGKSVKDVLSEGADLQTLVATKDEVDNDAGKFQVVKVTTSVPYPQILNALTFHGAGIVDAEWVEEHNKDVDIANYDATKDRLYGDTKYMEETSFDNDLSVSGNYVPCIKNDYEMKLQANPGLRTREDHTGVIKNITLKFIEDKDAALNSLRSGDVDFAYQIPSTKYSVVEDDPNLTMTYFPGIRVYVLAFNMHGNSVVSESADLRKAIAACMSFDALNAVNGGTVLEAYSPLSTCLDTGHKLNYQEGDVQKYLDAYFAGK